MSAATQQRRKSSHLRDYDYSSPGDYFVTMCAHNKRCLFGEVIADEMHLNEAGVVVEECWRAIPAHFPTVALDRFVVMPNHVHGIVQLHPIPQPQNGAMNRAPTKDDVSIVGAQFIAPSLGQVVVRAFKARCTVALRKQIFKQEQVWQRNYYEHVIRSEASLQAIREYIVNNPKQWALDKENPERVR